MTGLLTGDRRIGDRFPVKATKLVFAAASRPALDQSSGYRVLFPLGQGDWEIKLILESHLVLNVKTDVATAYFQSHIYLHSVVPNDV